jgi:hypothetical protein
MNNPEELQAILDEANSRGSLIDQHPALKAVQHDSARSLRYQPIKFWRESERRDIPKLPTGYGISQQQLNEYLGATKR